jgi:hypothetical protein
MHKKPKQIAIENSNKTPWEIFTEGMSSDSKSYKLSRWGQEVVKILQEKGEMKNVDIIAELRNRGCNTSATHIRVFFKSNDGKRFYKEELVGNQGYWSLKNK